MRVWIAVLLAWLGFAGSALAENRLALVIGNDSYQHIEALQKARADAKSYAALLREKGFSVEDRYDLGFVDMQGHCGSAGKSRVSRSWLARSGASTPTR